MRRLVPGLLLIVIPAMASSAWAQGEPSEVTIVHGLPRFTADIYVDGELLLSGFQPREATDPMELPADTYAVDIRDAGAAESSDPVLSADLEVPPGRNLSVVAHLDEGGNPTVSVFDNDVSRIAPGRARLLVRHQAAAPPVDVQVNGESLFAVASGEQAERSLPASTLDLAVTATDGAEMLVEPTTVDLQEGVAHFVYLIGSSEEQTLDFMVQAVAGIHTSPSEVQTGTGGLAATPAFPALAAFATAAAAAAAVGSGLQLLRRRLRRA
jgi:Domain of unknown function (DUF4397)